MLKIKAQYKGVSVEYLAGAIRVSKKIDQLTEADINTAQKWGVNLSKYFEKTELNTEVIPEPIPELPTIAYEGIEVKPKRKRK